VSGFTVCCEEDKLALLRVDRDALCNYLESVVFDRETVCSREGVYIPNKNLI